MGFPIPPKLVTCSSIFHILLPPCRELKTQHCTQGSASRGCLGNQDTGIGHVDSERRKRKPLKGRKKKNPEYSLWIFSHLQKCCKYSRVVLYQYLRSKSHLPSVRVYNSSGSSLAKGRLIWSQPRIIQRERNIPDTIRLSILEEKF